MQRSFLTLQRTLWLGVGLTMVSAVLAASALFHYRSAALEQASESARTTVLAEAYADQLAHLMYDTSSEDLSSAIKALRWHRDSNLLAVISPSGQVAAFRGNQSLLRHYLHQCEVEGAAWTGNWAIPDDQLSQTPALQLAAVPLERTPGADSRGVLVYANRQIGQTGASSEQVARFAIQTTLIASAGMVLALLWLRERLVRPIDILTRQYRRRKRDSSLTSLVEKRHDELGEVARVLDAATQDIEELRSQTKMLELAVDQRVQAKTRTVERELKKSEKQAWTDPLTQLGNRRILQERFAGIYDEHMRNRRDLSVAMIDVDNFKKLNDSLGHSAGDDLLRFIGELLKTSVRDTDLAIRQGGDEFVLVLPNVPASQAKAVAERVIRLFMQHASMLETRPHPSMSIGIASIYRNRPRDSAQLLELADEALYAAKSEGKAKVVLAGESDTAPTPAQAATK